MKTKKYPLLISLIISCALVVASLFVMGFFGLKLGTSLGGGSQFEVVVANDASEKNYVEEIDNVLSKYNLSVDTSFVEDKYIAGSENTSYTEKVLIVKIAETEISDADKVNIKTDIAESLSLNSEKISEIEIITSSTRTKNVLFLGIAVAVIAVALFVFGWMRYDIFAGLSFLLAYLHNIILYISMLVITRVQLSLIALAGILILTLVMSALLIQVYEKYREVSRSKSFEKQTISEHMIYAEKQSVKSYAFIAVTVAVVTLLLLIVPSARIRWASLALAIALIVTAYTSLIVGPGTYAALAEIKDYSTKAVMSRNDNVNKVIKKKIKRSTKKVSSK